MTAAGTFADWSGSLTIDDIPPDVRRAACRHLLDGMGTALAAARYGTVRFAVDAAASLGSSDESTVFASGRRLSAPAAALANGALVHALDFDDTHTGALVHPTSVVLPAAFAAGERTGATGAEVLTAAVAGYETIIRLGAVVPHGFHSRGLHATSVCGVFAAALVAAKLYGLDTDRTTDAIGIAGSLSSGSLEFLATGSSTKQLHPGFAAMSGLLAAQLASDGADGPDSILEGEHGLYAVLDRSDVTAADISDGLGSRWETARITIKPYPVCQLSHASLDALRAALSQIDEDVDGIDFEVPAGAVPIVCEPVESKALPRTPYEAKFSLSHCAALVVVDGRLTLGSFDRLDRPEVTDMARKVAWRIREFDGPPAMAPGVAHVRTVTGRTVSATVPVSRGGPDDPLSDDELLDKFHANAGGRSPDSSRLAELVLDLAAQPGVGAILTGRIPEGVA